MKILMIGGTYFLGKAFADLLIEKNISGDNIEIYLLNRGNNLPDNKNAFSGFFITDRHDEDKLSRINESFDVIVDFCAYQEGDIETILKYVKTKQYIFISTTDVYRRGVGRTIDENSEFEDRDFGGDAGAYILGKVSLEKEIQRLSEEDKTTVFTSIRPVFIYGPGNYAPRESMYFKWMTGAGQILHPSDSEGHFQMVYVKDVAKAIWLVISDNANACDTFTFGNVNNADDHRDNIIQNHRDDNYRAYNICDNTLLDYEAYADLMNEVSKKCLGQELQKVEITVSEIEERGIPLPFPLRKEESESYNGDKIKALGFETRDTTEAMIETFLNYISCLRE